MRMIFIAFLAFSVLSAVLPAVVSAQNACNPEIETCR